MARTRIRLPGRLLKELRVEHGFLSQDALAAAAGIGVKTIGRVENSQNWQVNGSTITCLATTFGMEDVDFLRRIEEFEAINNDGTSKSKSSETFDLTQQRSVRKVLVHSNLQGGGPIQEQLRRTIVSYALSADDDAETRDALRQARKYGESTGLLRLIDRDLAAVQDRFRDLHLKRAAVCMIVGKTEEAKRSVAQLLALAPHDGDALLLDAAVRRVGGDYETAATACRQVLRMVENGEMRLDALLLLGRIEGDLGQLDAAHADYDEGLNLAADIGVPLRIAEAHTLLAMNHRRRAAKAVAGPALSKSQLADARSHWGRALGLYRNLKDEVGTLTVMDNIATGHVSTGNLRRARRIYERLVPRNRLLGRRPGMAAAYGNLCMVLGQLGHYPQAIQSAHHASRLYRKIGWMEHVARAQGNIAQCYTLWERRGLAIKHWTKAQRLFESLGMTAPAMACEQNLQKLQGIEKHPPFMA